MTSVAASLMGSSPLMPGRRGRRFDLFPGRGLIPAHAGKTSSPASPASRRQAHPRSCRENMSASVAACCASGSSPLTRGKRQVLGRSRQVRQLIPAHAGKTLHNPAHRSASKAHPRSRGENFKDETRGVWGEGSSPLTRGKHERGPYQVRSPGLIPAHAGKTATGSAAPSTPRAHPHSRAEKQAARVAPCGRLGSSPLTRGKLPGVGIPERRLRLIPTHAGKTRGPTSYPFPGWAHPRSRGENMGSLFLQRHMVGSSPLTRGKRKPRAPLLHRDGLIPTHAGKMTGTWPPPCPSPAHPHSRRENAPHGSRKIVCPGSSPLMRGKRTHAAA